MKRTRYELSVDAITMDDLMVFEKATGSKLVEALSPRLIKDVDTGQPVMVPDPDDPDGRPRPLRMTNMTTVEMVGAILIASRMKDRANQKKFTKLDDVGDVKLTEAEFVIDWGTDEEASDVDPTEPGEPGTESN